MEPVAFQAGPVVVDLAALPVTVAALSVRPLQAALAPGERVCLRLGRRRI